MSQPPGFLFFFFFVFSFWCFWINSLFPYELLSLTSSSSQVPRGWDSGAMPVRQKGHWVLWFQISLLLPACSKFQACGWKWNKMWMGSIRYQQLLISAENHKSWIRYGMIIAPPPAKLFILNHVMYSCRGHLIWMRKSNSGLKLQSFGRAIHVFSTVEASLQVRWPWVLIVFCSSQDRLLCQQLLWVVASVKMQPWCRPDWLGTFHPGYCD